MIQLYNEHMGGVDLADQLRSYYPVARSSTHWYEYIFWYLFDVLICNSFLLSKMLPIAAVGKPKTQLDFRLELATQLIGNFSSHKRSIAAPVVGQETAQEIMGHFIEKIVGRKKQCVERKEAGRKTPKGYPVESKFRCRQCQLPLCRACFSLICCLL